MYGTLVTRSPFGTVPFCVISSSPTSASNSSVSNRTHIVWSIEPQHLVFDYARYVYICSTYRWITVFNELLKKKDLAAIIQDDKSYGPKKDEIREKRPRYPMKVDLATTSIDVFAERGNVWTNWRTGLPSTLQNLRRDQTNGVCVRITRLYGSVMF